MPTKIEEIYDAIVTLIEANLPGHKRLSNPYVLDANYFLQLQKAYAIAIGTGLDTERYVGCLVTWERSFSIILARQMTATQNNIEARELIEKDILIDHDILRKAFYLDSTLGQKAIKATVTGDTGVSFIDGDRLKFLAMELNLVVEYQEDPTS